MVKIEPWFRMNFENSSFITSNTLTLFFGLATRQKKKSIIYINWHTCMRSLHITLDLVKIGVICIYVETLIIGSSLICWSTWSYFLSSMRATDTWVYEWDYIASWWIPCKNILSSYPNGVVHQALLPLTMKIVVFCQGGETISIGVEKLYITCP